jgi:hypothetical protein
MGLASRVKMYLGVVVRSKQYNYIFGAVAIVERLGIMRIPVK